MLAKRWYIVQVQNLVPLSSLQYVPCRLERCTLVQVLIGGADNIARKSASLVSNFSDASFDGIAFQFAAATRWAPTATLSGSMNL